MVLRFVLQAVVFSIQMLEHAVVGGNLRMKWGGRGHNTLIVCSVLWIVPLGCKQNVCEVGIFGYIRYDVLFFQPHRIPC